MLLQRIFASVLLLACLGLALMAWPYQAAFSYEPVGPRAFPLLMLGLMGSALLYMVFRPAPIKHSDDEPPLDRETLTKIGICVVLLLVFAGTFEPLGFIVSQHPDRRAHGPSVWRSLGAKHRDHQSDGRRPLPAVRQVDGRAAATWRARRSGELIWILLAIWVRASASR